MRVLIFMVLSLDLLHINGSIKILILLPIINSRNSSMFGISIFPTPEHYLALYLGLFEHPQQSLAYLQILLARTKNPPLSILHTVQLLEPTAHPQTKILHLIRFLSQLSDMSQGTSMSTSLKGIINESSFLTQVRHTLTHRRMVNEDVLAVVWGIVEGEVKGKFWGQLVGRVCGSYAIDVSKVQSVYTQIYNSQLPQESLQTLQSQLPSPPTTTSLETCSPYTFKQQFPQFHCSQPNSETLALFPNLTKYKKSIGLAYLLNKFCHDNRNQELCELLIKILVRDGAGLVEERLVVKGLRKLSYLHYVGFCARVLQVLDHKVLGDLHKYWENKDKILKNHRNIGIPKLFKPSLLHST